MAKLGFLGLGIMGYPMARNLLRAGHEVAVWSHTAAKARRLADEAGGMFCGTPAEVGARTECAFVCVGDTEMSRQVLVGAQGVAEGAAPGTVVVDASTISPAASRAMGKVLATKGIHFLDAPCTGSKAGAEGGTLTFMVGGEREVLERVRDFFTPMGSKVYYCGGAGLGLAAKLAQNMITSNLLQAFNEAFVMSTKAGVDPELMLDIVNNSAVRSGLVAFKAPFVFNRDFQTNFSVKWMHKDVGLALEAGKELGVPLPLTGVTQQMFQAAVSLGYGDDDFCSAIKVLEGMSGVEVRRR